LGFRLAALFSSLLDSPIQMNENRGMPAHGERVILDGVPYIVSVYVKGTMYRAAWFCGACSNRSELRFEDSTIDAVLEQAKADLAAHHAAMHKLSSRRS